MVSNWIWKLRFLEEIFSMGKISQKKGAILIITFLILGVLLLLGTYFLSFTLIESRISKSQGVATKTYYLAEAGIGEAIWKLKNDDTTADGDEPWKDNFVAKSLNPDPEGKYWSATFTRSNVFGGSYTVTIQNSNRARGRLISTAKIALPGGKTAQRIVKTVVFKALAGPTADSAVFSGGASENIDIDYSKMKIKDGNLFSNHNLNIKGSTVEVYDNNTTETLEGQVLAVGNLNIKYSTLDYCETRCAKDTCQKCPNNTQNQECEKCPPDSLFTPLVDFDSEGSYSFKNRAQNAQDFGQCEVLCNSVQCDTRCVYSAEDFEDLLWEVGKEGTLTLNNEITYVTGPIELKGGRYLVVNGALLADDNIYIGERYCWTKGGQKDCGLSQITINRPTATTPSGLLTKRKIDFGLFSSFSDISITGVIYANDEIRLVSVPKSFNIVGGIIGRKLALNSVWQWLNITLDNEIILYGLGYKIDDILIEPVYSPVITIEHWEETY